MKKLILTGIAAFCFATMTLAQAPPQGVNYQAVAYDNKSSEIPGTDITAMPIAKQAIKVRFTIIKNEANGAEAYSEEHTTETDENGLFNLVIGKGYQLNADNFADIDWGTGLHFLKVEIDVSGNYNVMGTQQLWSVPYALYTEKAGNGVSEIIDNGGTSITFNLENGETYNVPLSGANGVDGAEGAQGPQGIQGSQGIQGPIGNTGPVGINGTDGNDGVDGISIDWLGTLTTQPTSATINQAYYNSSDGKSYIWNGVAWEIVAQDGTGGSNGGANTLNQAYNQGGLGAGRVITADNGAVEINGTNGAKSLFVTNNQNSAFGIDTEHTGTGVAIRGRNTNATNTFPAIQAETNSSDALNAALIAQNTGAGFGVAGQIPASATGAAAIYGNNLRTNGGFGVEGIGVNGVVGRSSSPVGYGVYGINTGAGNMTDMAIGTYGIGFAGVYGETNNPSAGWAGYFTSDVGIDGGIFAMGPGMFDISDGRLKSDIQPIENALDKIMQIKPKHYTIKTKSVSDLKEGEVIENTRQEFGVIAQELEMVFPGMVKEKAFFKSSGDDTEYKSVNYVQLIPVLVEALKELKEEVDFLKQELENLKNE